MSHRLIPQPVRVPAVGTPPKLIDEVVGRVNTGTAEVSIAHMHSPAGWSEPAQTPEFDEYTYVLKGTVHVESKTGSIDVHTGQAIHVPKGEWVRYSTPDPDGADYIAICLPAFSPDSVHRDPDSI